MALMGIKTRGNEKIAHLSLRRVLIVTNAQFIEANTYSIEVTRTHHGIRHA
jgi:hypothetical protein